MTDPAVTTPSRSAPPAGWEGILSEDERILWQGRPGTRLARTQIHTGLLVKGLAMAAFGLFWTLQARTITGSPPAAPPFVRELFALFGLIFVGSGLHTASGFALTGALGRRYTWYTLSHRAAYVATAFPWQARQLKTWPMGPATGIDYDGASPGSIWFAEETRGSRRNRHILPVGFEQIDGAARVYQLMRDIQKGQPA